MKKLNGILGLTAAGALTLTSLTATALPFSDQLVLRLNGGVIDLRTILENQEPQVAPSFINDGTANPAMVGQYIAIFEPDGVTVSDWVGVVDNGGGHVGLGFLSDPIPGIAPLYFHNQVGAATEGPDGITIDVSQFLNPILRAQGYTATFQSDGDPVPDAGTSMALLGIALAGIGFARRKLA